MNGEKDRKTPSDFAMIPHVRLAIGVLTTVLAIAPQTPVFRSRVDLVTVDVAVIDANGRPVTGLTAQDFSIRPTAGHATSCRRTTSPPGPRGRGAAAEGGLPLPAPSSNSLPPAGRTFLFVIDTEHSIKAPAAP